MICSLYAPQGNKGIFQISGSATEILDQGSDWQVDLRNREDRTLRCRWCRPSVGERKDEDLGAGTANIGCRSAVIERERRCAGHVYRRAEIECQGHRARRAIRYRSRVGVIENRGRIVFKAVRGDRGAGDHVDVTETLDRAVIWPPGDAFPDVVVYTPVAEAARVNVVIGDSECPVDEVGGEPENETGCRLSASR